MEQKGKSKLLFGQNKFMKNKKSVEHDVNGAKIFIKDARDMSEIPNESVNLVITSPPYWTLKDYEHDNQIGFKSSSYEEYIKNLNKVWQECIRVLAPDGKICINIMPFLLTGKSARFDRRETRLVISDLEHFMNNTNEMYTFALFIWDKRKIARFSSFGSYPFPPNIFSTFPYEWIVVFSKKGKRNPVSKEIKEASRLTTKEWQDWAINSIWEMQPARAKSENHPAPFPEELPSRLIKLYSFVGDTVLDPFIGTGTTALAALKLKRKAIGYDSNKEYLELIKKKLKK